MGQAGSAADNAANGVLLSPCSRTTSSTAAAGPPRDERRIALVPPIERTYRRRRRQATLGRLTPIEFENIMTAPATQTA
jgi:putative transposase